MHKSRTLLLIIVLVFFTFCSEQVMSEMKDNSAVPPLYPMEDFFKNPEKIAFRLSPNGEYLAFLSPWKNRLNVHIQKIGEDKVVRVTEGTERDIGGFFWANNDRIAFVQDTGGDENYHLFAVDKDGTDKKELTPFEKVKVNLVDDLEDNENEMLISMNKRNPQLFDVYRININSGEMEMIAENPGGVVGWGTDHDGNLRIATATDGVNQNVLYRKTEKDPFQVLLTTSFKDTLSPLEFTFDNNNFYVASNIGRDKIAIFEYNIEKKEQGKLLFEHPEVDVDNLMISKKRKVITGVSYLTDKRQYHFFDDDRKQLQAELLKLLPDYEIGISWSKDERKVLVRSYSDRSLGAYYFYNRDTKEFKKLHDISPWLDEEKMAPQKPISYKSRDGLTIHGYLTLPLGAEPKNLPVVVNPHGGPWHRDSWGFNPEVQFLANRGYAVLQMNFRGSTGYGRDFWTASFKQWGKTMQDDITDGVKWLIEQGIADPKKVGIYGASYGGYATLAGLVYTPDLYACGVDYVGVSNMFSFMKAIPPYWKPMLEMMYEMVGHPEKDKEFLTEVSPVFHADKIKVPLFIAQGANDPRVPQAESDQMVEALKKRGIEVPYMVKDNEGHGFMNEENRFDFYRAMEQFLAKHLGGRAEEKK
ncbi:alpha/beta fold hydrolase [candidate division CSSED10-310 bacterium]|uniref:Alpha/beta fold hydrolase n=1 Tax=candidate division CSSED10-310 bacterium TaxID=2855610 RepID=A0ABV6YU03_UNCC1